MLRRGSGLMKISKYIVDFTSGERIYFKSVIIEIGEMIKEVFKLNWKGVNEEWQDALHFVQLWLYWKFKKDGEVWECTKSSVQKFMDRVMVWHDIYEYAGLPRTTSNFCGNYHRPEKVVKQLAKYGIDEKRAMEAYHRIVKGV